ncbi:hypothetical protein Scep_022918 [Stephania cephalantha]|uniref:Bet v I/Major latex protein domain-containing protein n=1 Tax=Stephania cephalantha TaxID=152367 RepID=A0AAP0FHK1_9MAGN
MAQVKKIEKECEVRCPVDKMYEFFRYNIAQFTKILPEHYKSCELLEGDGKGYGTVRLWTYTLGGPEVMVAKEAFKAIDDANKTITYRIFDADLNRMYKSFDIVVKVVPNANGTGSLVKWHVLYEKEHEDHPHPHPYLELFSKVTNAIDSHLHKP